MKLHSANYDFIDPSLVALDSTLVTDPENKSVCNPDGPGFFRQLAANSNPACAGISKQNIAGAIIKFHFQSVSLAYTYRAVAVDIINAGEMPAVGKHFYILSFGFANQHPGLLLHLSIQELEIV